MKNEFFEELLKMFYETVCVYKKDELVYKNHDILDDQNVIGTKNVKIMGDDYKLVFYGKKEVDSLTGFLTKGSFNDYISNLSNINDCVLVFCDIDNLKYYNEKYGHIETDKVIKGIANIISSNVRKSDLVGRFGGDEFVILLKDTNSSKSFKRIEDIRKKICSSPYNLKTVDGKLEEVFVSVTFGISKVDKDIYHSMIDADNMLVNGKKEQKNKVYIKK